MSNVCGLGGANRFPAEQEEALRRDDPTNAVLGRDAKATVAIRGDDLSWRETKTHQQEHIGLHGLAELAATGYHGLEIVGAIPHVAALCVVAPLAGFGVGLYGLSVAEGNADAQDEAFARGSVHVALISALDLPAAYKQDRLEGAFAEVAAVAQSPASRMAFALHQDPKALAVLQLHADRGMHAARDLLASGMTADAFLRANPKIADACAKDAAFHEGFHAFLHAQSKLPPMDAKAMEQQLLERDCRYTASAIPVRM